MKRLFGAFLVVVLIGPGAAMAKSIARPGDPRLTFVDISLSVPLPIELGTPYRLSATVIPVQNIWEEEKVFLHIVSPEDTERITINADFEPPSPTTRWAVGEAVKLGPINLEAPRGIRPGKYRIQFGLFHQREDGVYVREKYTNPEIKDWIVGDIEFYQTPKTVKKQPDFIISDFSSHDDLAKWQTRSARIKRVNNIGVVEYIADEAQTIPSVILQDFFNYSDPKYSDWRNYDVLSYDIELDPAFRVTLQIKDKAGNRFQTRAAREDKAGEVRVDLISVRKVVDLGDIGNLSFFTYKPQDNFQMLLSDIKLIDTGEVAFEKAFIEFKGLSVPRQAVAGTTIPLTARFLIHQRFPRDEIMFIHFYRKSDRGGFFDADKVPLTETTEWDVGKLIKEGPLKIYIPPDSPPGIYNIDLGFYAAQKTGLDPSYVKSYKDSKGVITQVQPTKDGIDYLREPYVNPPPAGPWTVGQIEIIPAKK